MRLRVLGPRSGGTAGPAQILAETRFDAGSKVRVCVRTLQQFLEADIGQLKIQVCRVSDDGRYMDTARAVSFASFRKLVVDQWVFSQVRRGRLKCFYQPIVDTRRLRQPTIVGHEALVRCRLPGGLTLHAKELFALAYTPELARELHVAALWCCLRGSRKIGGKGKLFINIDPAQVNTGGRFWKCVSNVLNENGTPRENVVFEIVESLQHRDVDIVTEFCSAARVAGYRIALDDFGKQANPIQLLLAVRPNVIKLETGLIRQCANDRWRRCVAENLVSLARSLSIKCIVEGVESDTELEWATQNRATLVQGYKFGRPSPDPVFTVKSKSLHQPRPYIRAVSLTTLLDTQSMLGRP